MVCGGDEVGALVGRESYQSHGKGDFGELEQELFASRYRNISVFYTGMKMLLTLANMC